MSRKVLSLIIWIGTAALVLAQQKLPVEEVERALARHTEARAEESPTTFPDLKIGFSDDVIRVAEQMAAGRGIVAEGDEAIEVFMDEIRRKIAETGSAEAAVDLASAEAIVIASAELRPALRACNNRIDDPVPLTWHDRLNSRQAALQTAMQSVGLIHVAEVPNSGSMGSGFVVGPNIVMTNRHVAETFALSDGNGGFTFRKHPATGQPARVTIDFTRDRCSLMANPRQVTKILHIEPEPGPDVALLEVRGEIPPALTLQTDPISDGLAGREVFVVGFPFSDSRNPFDIQTQIFGFQFGIKRLAPGGLMQGSGQPLAAGQEPLLLHDCSTLGGNSGSAVFDLGSNRVIGVHFAGSFSERNFAWPMWRVVQVARVREHLGM